MIDSLIPVVTVPNQYKNEDLRNATRTIISIGDDIKSSLMEIAFIISDIDAKSAYKDDGFESVHDWTAKTFGYKQAMSYNLLKLGKEYVAQLPVLDIASQPIEGVYNYKSNLYTPEELAEHEDFTSTQIMRMFPLGREKAVEMVKNRVITPDMSSRDIKAIVDANKPAKRGKSSDDNSTSDSTEPPIEPTTPRNKKLVKFSTDDLIAELVARGYKVISPGGLTIDDTQ